MYEHENPNRVTIVEREKEIALLEKQEKIAETEEEMEAKEIREREARVKRVEELKIERKKVVFKFFKIFAKREMTNEEYDRYIAIYENPRTRKGYNIKNFFDGDDGKEVEKK